MADHPRKTIRYAIVNLLMAAGVTGGRVYPNRPMPGWKEELPYTCVYTTEESVESNDAQPANYERKPIIRVEIVDGVFQTYEGVVAKINTSLDDDMDAAAKQVEDALLAVEKPWWLVDPVSKAETADGLELGKTSQTLTADGDQVLGSTIIEFHPVYHSRFEPVETPVQFDNADVKIGTVPPGIEAEAVLQTEP